MSAVNSDVLVEIVDTDLPQLASMYEKEVTWAPHVYSLIKMGIKWKRSKKFQDCIRFYSPDNSWLIDGAIVVITELYCYNIFVFTLEENCINLCRGLTQTNRIDFKKENAVFFCVHEKHLSTVFDVVKTKNVNIRMTKSPYFMYTMPSVEARLLEPGLPLNIYAKKLNREDAPHINAVWPHKFEKSEQYLSNLIEINGGCGLFLKDNDEMVAWGLKHCLGHVGMLQTEEKHQKKGYGTLITKILAKEIGEEGHWPFATILADNTPSISMFERTGFRKIGTCAYVNLC